MEMSINHKGRKTKLIEINHCYDCPRRFEYQNFDTCSFTENERKIENISVVPTWCPLCDIDHYIKIYT